MEQDYLKLVKIMITLTFLTGLLIGLAIGTGDILKSFTYSNSGELKRIDKLKVVEFNNFADIYQGYQIYKEDEIIGNIYDNKELLNNITNI
jgi:hypothetical protein